MKKAAKIIGITIAALLCLLIAGMLIIPIAFKEKIKAKVEQQINGMVNAKVTFADYRLSLVRAFPNASFSLEGLNIVGMGQFDGDTLASLNSFSLVFNLMSLLSDEGYEVKSIVISKPMVNAKVSENGSANWDIMKEAEAEVEAEKETGPPAMRLKLRRLAVTNGRISFADYESDMHTSIDGLGFNLSGNMSAAESELSMDLTAQSVNFMMDRISYIRNARLGFHSAIKAQLDSMIFILKDNSFNLNDIVLRWSGSVAMPGDDITADLAFNTPETSFKSLLSLVPAIYMKDFEGLRASGSFSLDGTIKGVYSAADSTLPGIGLKLLVSDGMISYPDLPEKITAINIDGEVKTDGREMDNSTVNISRFHFELAGNPFDMTMKLATPVSDPSVAVSAKGRIDLAKLEQAIPLDSVSMNGLIDLSLSLAGRMSMIENEKYDQFRADGNLTLSGMTLEMPDLPSVKISNASFFFNPAYSELKQLRMTVGEKSDFTVSGRLENYIPYLFSDGTVRGNMSLSSNMTDLNEIMDKIPSDTTTVEDTTALALIKIPRNIDFTFNAFIGKLVYDRLNATDVRGNIVVRDGVVKLRETGMKALGGALVVNADYDTRDTLKPQVKADMRINAVNIREAFNTFNTVRQLAPVAKGLAGDVSAGFSFESLLGSDMMPLLSTITGSGEVRSEAVQVVESQAFDQMKGLLKLKPDYTNVIKDLKATFSITGGRLYVKPFDTRVGNVRMNISGDQGLDKTLNYAVKTEIPRSDLGAGANALIASLSAQAALLGITYVPSDIIKVNLKVGGTVARPVITPSFAGSESAGSVTAVTTAVKEEAVKQVAESAREQADRILKEAEEQAKILREEAASAAKTIRNEADLQGQKLIKDAESKGALAVVAAKKASEALKKEADKRAAQLEKEANDKADKILEEARIRADEALKNNK